MPQVMAVSTESLLALKSATSLRPDDNNENKGGQPAVDNSGSSASSGNQSNDRFSGVIEKAGEQAARERQAENTGDASESDPEGGKLVPEQDTLLPDGADLMLSLDINRQGTAEEFDGDEAILLATRFVMTTLPEDVRQITADVELTAAGSRTRADLMSKLEASIQLLVADAATGKSSDTSVEGFEQSLKVDETEQRVVLTPLTETKLMSQSRTEIQLPVRIDSPNWGESIAGRISLLINQRLSSARIHINPPELGPIEVRLNINSDQASVQFVSHSAQVRDALEQSIPRLREMLESAGFSLADSFVGDEGQHGSDERTADDGGQATLPESDRDSLQPVGLCLIDQYV